MSNSPIFDQLVSEFAAKGAVYEEFVKFSTPAFSWTPQHVVQLDKQKTGVKLGKLDGVRPQVAYVDEIQLSDSTMNFGRLIQNYIPQQSVPPTTSVMPLSERNTA